MDIKNKVAVVTGGASGLGLGTVASLAEKGAKVVIFYLNEELAKRACEELGENVNYFIVNVSDEASVQSAIENVIKQFGTFHICVNCAGVAHYKRP